MATHWPREFNLERHYPCHPVSLVTIIQENTHKRCIAGAELLRMVLFVCLKFIFINTIVSYGNAKNFKTLQHDNI